MYKNFFKPLLDFILAFIALIVLSPLLIILTISGAIAMRGNPFFTQPRPGKKRRNGEERIFRLIKFRTMSNKKDINGNLLSDEIRLNKYGKFLRSTSLDELPSLINILFGSISIVGPRPLLVSYLSRYSLEQRRRHEVRPGLTGYSQVYGRNLLSWEEKLKKDVYYVDNISLWLDVKIFFKTIIVVLRREGISSATSATMEEFMGNETKKEENV